MRLDINVSPGLIPNSPVSDSLIPVFNSESDFNDVTYFYLNRKIIPSIVEFYHVDRQRFYQYLVAYYKVDEKNVFLRRMINDKNRVIQAYLQINEHADVYFPKFCSEVKLLYDPAKVSEDSIQAFAENINEYRIIQNEKYLNLIVRSPNGLSLEEFAINPEAFDLNEQYNDDFRSCDEIIKSNLETDGLKGIILLHGIPGTGKTSYIKHLVTTVKRRFIFLPSNMAADLTEPDFISFISYYTDSILIIEDAEEVLANRDGNVNSAMSNLLSLGDGLLSDCLRIRIICTFNAKLNRIDPAILRKGRIIARYEFRPLEFEKAKRLAIKNNINHCVEGAMTLAEIYNAEKKSAEIETVNSIGFLKN